MKKSSLLNLFLIISIVIFIISLSILLISRYFQPVPVTSFKIDILGPSEVDSLETYPYTISLVNNSNQKLSEVVLKIYLSEGVFLKDNINEKEISFFIGDLNINDSYKKDVELFFLNKENSEENIKALVTYKIKNKLYTLEKTTKSTIIIKNPAIKTQIYLPNKVYVNQEFKTTIRLINLTDKTISNIKVNVMVPANYSLNVTLTKSEKTQWEINSIDPGDTKEISLFGQIEDINSDGIFNVDTSFEINDLSFSITKETAKVGIMDNPVSFIIKSSPSNVSVPIGSNIRYEIILENKSKSILENNEVRVSFYGPFDLSFLNSNGYYSQIDQILYWNSRNKSELLKLKPNDKVFFSFSIPILKSYPILDYQNKDFSTKIRVEFRSKTIPIDIETMSKEYVVFKEDEKKINGKIEISHELVHKDDYFPENELTPFPLEAETLTNFAWHIRIKTIGEDFENINLNTKFPIGINITGKIGGDALIDNLKFETSTGMFFYNLNKLPANLGYLEKEIDLAFQVSVVPAANIDLRNLIIIPQVQYSAIGSFSKVQTNGTLREIRVSNITK